MQSDVKIQRLIFQFILSIVILSNVAYAQQDSPELHEKTLEEITKDISSQQEPHIDVGDKPTAIGVNPKTNRIYVANQDDGTVSVIDGSNNTKIGNDIPVGMGPVAIGVDFIGNKIFVANEGNNSVSVIDGSNNRKIGNDIPVGKGPADVAVSPFYRIIYVANPYNNTVSVFYINGTKIGNDIVVGSSPRDIGVDPYSNTIFVANQLNNSVSEIDGHYMYIINNIGVGNSPVAIAVEPFTNTIYVANRNDKTVSVINETNRAEIKNEKFLADVAINPDTNRVYTANPDNDTVSVFYGNNGTKIGNDIAVGKRPMALGVDPSSNTIYVANQDDDTVSVIDGKVNKVVAGLTFYTEPFNGGHIECDNGKIVPTARQIYVYSGSECTAKPNEGFEFVSWQENLGGNSSRILNFSLPNTWYSVLQDSILEFLHSKPDKQETILDLPNFGSFTANFKARPPPIPSEYLVTLFAVVVSAFIGSWLTPTVIEWRRTKRQGSRLDHYHNEVKNLGNLDSEDIGELNNLKDNIADEYSRGRITKEQHDTLANEISVRYREIFKKEMDSLDSLPDDEKIKLLHKLNDDISDAYARERINDLHHTLLKERLTSYEKK